MSKDQDDNKENEDTSPFASSRPLGISEQVWAHLCEEVNGAYTRLRNVYGSKEVEQSLPRGSTDTVPGVQGEGVDSDKGSAGG